MTTEPHEAAPISLKEFLESVPPGRYARVAGTLSASGARPGAVGVVDVPEIESYCTTETCSGFRMFQSHSHILFAEKSVSDSFINYACRNCGIGSKTFAVRLEFGTRPVPLVGAQKFGEIPQFGPPTPPRVLKLLGPDGDLYIKGRRSESQALGIGAFGYYRRVVENQKTRIIEEIIKAARRLGAGPDMIGDLEAAATETQFDRAVKAVRHGIPHALLIGEQHNPLTLLHAALSEGLHAQSDDECLELAATIRLVLAELSERIGEALRNRVELDGAVTKLLNRKPQR